MTTYDERWYQAHRNAVWKADLAYKQGRDKEEMWFLYYGTYNREMNAFEQLEKMRKPAANQIQVDAMAAGILREARCPQCDTPMPSGRCAHCEGE